MGFKRSSRVADLIKDEISDILLKQVRDPRTRYVTVTDVKMTDDLRLSTVFFVSMGDAVSTGEAGEGLERASGFLRRELGKRLRLRYVPELRFIFDKSFEYGDRIERLISDLRK
ncbi:MAG: 30S ribosome-binding factor RbfA [Deltaproteobacteria bacterium]|nr:30S ribosome-binding factor RbfA [Deltaproteobacteria bacterium]